jgi:predicted MFS family arabinose efflux permease
MKKTAKTASLAILAFGAAIIYLLPYLRYVFYSPLQEALGLTHGQFGFTMSVFGFCATLSYWPGGWLADRVSPRKLLTVSYLSTGLLGFWLSSYPPYWASVAIHGLWGISTSLTFWAALIKATKDLAASEEQGRFFGLLESGRGLFATGFTFFTVWLFGRFAEPAQGLFWSIVAISSASVLAGLLTWLSFEDPAELVPGKSLLKDVGRTIKSPLVWGLAVIIFTAYVARSLGSFMNPYLNDVMLVAVATTSLLATIWNYVGQFVGGPAGGFLADKAKSRPEVVAGGFILMCVSFAVLWAIPGKPGYAVLSIAFIILMFLSMYVVRGVYFALMDDMRIPAEISGAAIGLASLVGFTPEIFVYSWAGGILDRAKETGALVSGYQAIFLAGMVATAVGLLTGVLLIVKIKRLNKTSG